MARNLIRHEEPGPLEETPRWMVTFSDLSTLLFTFFVLLVSMSTLDSKTLQSMFHNFAASSGFFFNKDYGEISRPKEVLIQSLSERLKDDLVVRKADDTDEPLTPAKEKSQLDRTGTSVVVENFQGGFKLVFGHKLLFPSGSADITEDIKPVLQKIGSFMRNSDYQIYIDGHTDNVPLRGGRYRSNEELSLARALHLTEYFVKLERVSPHSIAVAGYGEIHPVDTRETPEGKARNRRVEIIFKSQKYF
ncbi:MAG: flagellar motor protein MotB [Thermodesulfobacteriota bacterium]